MDLLNLLKCRLEVVNDNVSSRDLVNRLITFGAQEEPLHLVELDTLVKRHYDWLRHLPRVRPFYAIKSNDDAALIETTILLGCGFECASKAEVQRVLGFGVDPERIIFAQPVKTIESIKYAKEKKIRTVFDSEVELRKLHEHYPKAEVLIRYRFDSRNAKDNVDNKFGCDPEREAHKLLQLAKELGIKVVGWCFNIGSACSACYDAEIFYDAIRKGREISDFATTLGFRFNYIDLGGGFSGDKDVSIEKYAVHINRALNEFYPNDKGLTIIAEPGRYYSAAAVTSIISVHGKRVFRDDENKIDKIFFYFNDGIFGSFSSVKFRNQPVSPIIWKKLSDCEPEYKSTLFGPTCDGSDFFASDIQLPELNISNFVVFENQGAYTRVHSCRFNGFHLPRVIIFIRRSVMNLLVEIIDVDNPDKLVLSSKYLRDNNIIEHLKFE